jgi:hypothetical protein
VDSPRGLAAGTIWQAVDPNAAAFLRKCDFCKSIKQTCKLLRRQAAAPMSHDIQPASVYEISLYTGSYDGAPFLCSRRAAALSWRGNCLGDAFLQIDVALGAHVPSASCSMPRVGLQN